MNETNEGTGAETREQWQPKHRTSVALEKREWHYALHPRAFEVSDCECGSGNYTWSEYWHHCWCFVCEKDYVPVCGGIFDGPIPMNTCALMGIVFDRVMIPSGELDRFNLDEMKYESEMTQTLPEPPQ